MFYAFSSTKSENRRAEQVLPWVKGLALAGGRRWWGKGLGGKYGANNVYTCK
jgi:hypothetical protein